MEKLLLMGPARLTSQMVVTLVSILATTLATVSQDPATPLDRPSRPLELDILLTTPANRPAHQLPLLTRSCKTEARGSRPVMMDLRDLQDPRDLLEVPLDHQVDTLAILAGVTRDILAIEDR